MGIVLIISDDDETVSAVREELGRRGHTALVASDDLAGLSAITVAEPDLIVYDEAIASPSAAAVSDQARLSGRDVPLFVIGRVRTGREGESRSMNHHQYFSRPLRLVEFVESAETALSQPPLQGAAIEHASFGDVCVDFRRFEATKCGEPLELTAREFRILKYLIEREGEVVTRDELLEQVWNYNEARFTRTVDMHIAKLRKKIEATPTDPRHVITVHRVGYRFRG